MCQTLKVAGAKDVKTYLKENDVLKLFPHVETFINNDLLPNVTKSPLWSHLSSFTKFNQVSYFS